MFRFRWLHREVWCVLIFLFASVAAVAQVTQEQIDLEFELTLRNKNISSDSLLDVGKNIIEQSSQIGYEKGVVKGKIAAGRGFLYSNQLDSAATLLLDVIQTSENNDPGSFEEGLGHNYLGSVFTRLNNHTRALQEFTAATSIFKKIGNIEYTAVGLSNTGTAYGAQDNLIKALEFFLESQKLASNTSVTDNQRANILSNISIVYNLMNKKREALRFAFAALTLDINGNNKVGICQSYNAIGNIYKEHNEFDSALLFFNKTLSLAVFDDPEFAAIALRAIQNKADIYTQQNNFQDAIRLLRQIQRSKSEYQLEVINNYLSEYYNKLKKYDSAIYFARVAMRRARLAGSKTALAGASANLNRAYFSLGKFDSAYHYQSQQFAYNDTVYNERNRTRFDNLRIELETLDKEREIYAVKKEAELSKATDMLLLVLLVATFLVVVLLLSSVILLFKNRQKEQQLKTIVLEDKLLKSNADLRNQALRMIHINTAMQDLESRLKKLKSESPVTDVNQILRSLTGNQSIEKEWDSFNEYFGSIHVGFYEKLTNDFPHLTIADKRLAGLVRMNLTNREIAGILGIEDASVKTAKHRLKKKLNLGDEQELSLFLTKVTNDENNQSRGASTN